MISRDMTHDSRRLQWRRDERQSRQRDSGDGRRWSVLGMMRSLLQLELSGRGCKSSLERRLADKF